MKLIFLFLSLALAIGVVASLPGKTNAKANANKKITICHATGSESNPFVEITINKNGWGNGHEGRHNLHQGDKDFVVNGGECPSGKKSETVPPQVAGISVSPEISAAQALPQGGSKDLKSLLDNLGL